MLAKALLAVVAIACAAGLAVDDAAALKASGTSAPRYGAATSGIVCGDRLCSELEPLPEPAPETERESAGPALRELAPGVYNYFAGRYASLVVISEGEVLVTDPANDERAAMMKEAVESITDAPVKYVAMSHEHYDHVGGASVFEGAQVVCHVNCQPIFDLDPRDISPEVDITFTDYLELDVGGITVQLHYLGPGDGDATTVMYLPEEQVVYTTDMYEPRELTNAAFLDDSNSTGRQSILGTIAEWPLKHAISGHSDQTDPEILYENVEFLDDLREAVLDAIRNSEKDGFMAVVDVYQNPNTVRVPQYSDWEGYDEYIDRHVQRMVMSLFHGD